MLQLGVLRGGCARLRQPPNLRSHCASKLSASQFVKVGKAALTDKFGHSREVATWDARRWCREAMSSTEAPAAHRMARLGALVYDGSLVDHARKLVPHVDWPASLRGRWQLCHTYRVVQRLIKLQNLHLMTSQRARG